MDGTIFQHQKPTSSTKKQKPRHKPNQIKAFLTSSIHTNQTKLIFTKQKSFLFKSYNVAFVFNDFWWPVSRVHHQIKTFAVQCLLKLSFVLKLKYEGEYSTLFVLCFRNGSHRATNIELAEPRFQGVVCSMKESFGFIERADVVKEVRPIMIACE